MLKQRILTALALVFVFVIALFAKPLWPWYTLVGVAVVLAYLEWLKLAQVSDALIKVLGFAALGLFVFIFYTGVLSLPILLLLAVVLWLVLAFYTFRDSPKFISIAWVQALLGAFILAVTAVLLIKVKLEPNGLVAILLCFATVWCADIGAYFAGRRFGKHKLAPSISPGKTIEGVIGGLLLVSLVLVPSALYLLNVSYLGALFLWGVLILVALISVVGDLYESKLKRAAGLKDSGKILPGHGGILDRLDSLFPALPFLFFGLLQLGLI